MGIEIGSIEGQGNRGHHSIYRHYQRVGKALAVQTTLEAAARYRHIAQKDTKAAMVMLVAQVNELTVRSLSLARSMSGTDLHVVTIASDPERLSRLQQDWEDLESGVTLEVIDSPFRELVGPAVAYVTSLQPSPQRPVLVVIPELVVPHWWQMALHNQDALRLRAALRQLRWVSVVSIPYRLDK